MLTKRNTRSGLSLRISAIYISGVWSTKNFWGDQSSLKPSAASLALNQSQTRRFHSRLSNKLIQKAIAAKAKA